MSKSILMIAGEASGDTVGGLLAAELKLLRPDIELFGLGGDRMDLSGVDVLYHINQLSVLGFWEVLKRIPFIKKVENRLLIEVAGRKPSLAILIDYPGFNLRLASRMKSLGIPVMYYVSPQVWAWGRGRIAKIRRLVDRMIVVFEFEKKIYEEEGMKAQWHGHPLLEIVKSRLTSEELKRKIGLNAGDRYFGLFPGSRRQEIERILPVMKGAVDKVSSKRGLKCAVGCAPGVEDEFYRSTGGEGVIYSRGLTYELMQHAELNLVASGTATLECAMLGRPLFVLYKTSPITYIIARRLIKIPYVGLVNVVAGERIVPEFIQNDCRIERVAREAEKFLADGGYRSTMMGKLNQIRGKLGSAGASRQVARSVLAMLESG